MRPSDKEAIFLNALGLKSRSPGLHPSHLSTRVIMTEPLGPLTDTRRPQKGELLGFGGLPNRCAL